MSQSGVNYFLDKYADFNFEPRFKMWFDFKSTDLSTISRSGADSLYTATYNGLETPIYDYRYFSSTGSSYLDISPSTGFWDNQFTLMALNEKTDSNRCVLFNCFSTGLYDSENVYKGFIWGYADGSKPMFYYYGPNGPETFVANFSVDKNHSTYLVRDGNNIILGKYDFLKGETQNNSFVINSNYLFEPESYSLGNNKFNEFPSQLSGDGKQKLDEFIFFNWPLSPYDIKIINSGWVADYVPSYTGSGIITTTGITGVENITNYVTGITGWGIIGTGYLTNEYGISYTGYLSGNLTGTILQSGVSGLTGIINTPEFFIVPESIQVNTGFLRQFYRNYITFLRETDELDFNSIYYETGYIDSPKYIQFGSYDQIQEKIKVFRAEYIQSYVNGVANFSGSRTNSGTIYNPNWILEKDYFRTGNYLDSNGFYDEDDDFWYQDADKILFYSKDVPMGSGTTFAIPFPTQNISRSFIFTNGQRRYFGLDYSIVVTPPFWLVNFLSSTPRITGDFCVIVNTGFRTEETGNFAWKQSVNNFNPNYTIAFMNGQQQTNNIDFISSDQASMLSGSGIFVKNESLIFNNININDLFFN